VLGTALVLGVAPVLLPRLGAVLAAVLLPAPGCRP
jgi:hypothetical protein